jgi:hypothetical protein
MLSDFEIGVIGGERWSHPIRYLINFLLFYSNLLYFMLSKKKLTTILDA